MGKKKIMNLYNLDHVSGIASTLLSTVAFVIALFLTPLTKVLPEEIGLPIFIIFFPTTIIFASLGVILGGLGLTSASKPFHLVGGL